MSPVYIDALQFCLIALGITLLLMVLLPALERWHISITLHIAQRDDYPATGDTTRLVRGRGGRP